MAVIADRRDEVPTVEIPVRTGLPRRRTRQVIQVLSLLIAIGTPLWWARAYFIDFGDPENLLVPFNDTYTYLAAGERLNVGHELYRLQEGDRAVVYIPGSSTAPLFYPPPIAALWRPLAAIPFGFELWVVACWMSVLGTAAYLVLRVGIPAVILSLVVSQSMGEQLAVTNIAAFFPAIFVVSWRYRHHPLVGAAIGLISAIKFAPVAMTGWLFAERRWAALGTFVTAVALTGLVGIIGAGLSTYFEYLDLIPTFRPSPLSLATQTGIPWASYGVLLLGTAIAATLGRWPKVSFCVAVLTVVAGTPVIYQSGLVTLLALGAPLVRPFGHRDETARSAELAGAVA